MSLDYNRLLLEELRMAVCERGVGEPGDADLAAAVTMNENLQTLGYTLKPADLAAIAVSPSLAGFYQEMQKLIGQVSAKPMYPDFPKQVMELPEAQFRMHQMIHYFSTYGLTALYGGKVSRGWLADVPDTEKTEKDKRLLESKVLELVDVKDQYTVPLTRILKKRERMTIPEYRIVKEACQKVEPSFFSGLRIPFKENLMGIFCQIFTDCERDTALAILRNLCQHTGDVWRCIDLLLTRKDFHLSTSGKRFLVRLLESYPIADFKANLILSRKKANRVLLLLNYLDYNKYSRSPEHKNAVAMLRGGKLKSWSGQADELLSTDKDGALDFIAGHPGTMLRMVASLLRRGCSAQKIRELLTERAGALRTQTLVSVLQTFDRWMTSYEEPNDQLMHQAARQSREPLLQKTSQESEDRYGEQQQVYEILYAVLEAKLRSLQTPLRGKKVFLDMDRYDLNASRLSVNQKSKEGGYIRSGIAYRIPEEVRRIRFFVYWNDPDRVDVDLHLRAERTSGGFLAMGWDEAYKERGLVFSGDITHSDAAEYMDIDLDEADIVEVTANINLYSGKRCFGDIRTCFVGMMAVDSLDEKVRLYDPANCFFAHELKGKKSRLQYGYIDVKNRYLMFLGTDNDDLLRRDRYAKAEKAGSRFTLKTYLELLLAAQEATAVRDRLKAEILLTMDKAREEYKVSLIDENFFLDGGSQEE